MKRAYITLLGIALLGSTGLAQRQATLTITDFVAQGTHYSFDVYARNTGAQTIRVGTSSFYFNYNQAALASPTLTNINPRYTGQVGVDDYDPMTVDTVAGQIAVTVWYTGNATELGALLSTDEPIGERICTINLMITNSSQSANLSWNTGNSALTHSGGFFVEQIFVGSDESPLPIQLASFSATAISGNRVALEWTTLSEINNYGFEVQKAAGQPQGFTTISNSFIAGHGTTNQPHTYTYIDESATQGIWYYRLKQIDLDGTIRFSDAIQVEILTGVDDRPVPTVYALDQNYPNPFNPATVIDFALPAQSHVRLEIYNIIGQKIATLVDEVRAMGYYSEKFDASGFASGLYFYRFSTGDVSFLKKMTLLK